MVEVGTYIRLQNNAFAKWFARDKNWNDRYFCIDQFQNVCLWFPNLKCRGENAKIIFDSSISKIIEIEYRGSNEPLFVTTELFWIILPSEIEILNSVPDEKVGFEQDKKTIDDLEFFELKYREGLFDVLERENNKSDSYKREFSSMKRAGKWKHITQ